MQDILVGLLIIGYILLSLWSAEEIGLWGISPKGYRAIERSGLLVEILLSIILGWVFIPVAIIKCMKKAP